MKSEHEKVITHLSILSGFYNSPFMMEFLLRVPSVDLFSITSDLYKMNYKNTI